jgi:lysine-N-methylase
MGRRFKENISRDGVPHFILSDGERCPFLNCENLCDIILSSGEDSLCTICREHPRFHNSLPGRVESGLGLSCEEAARIIIGQSEHALLEISGAFECDDEIIALRDEVILLLQNRDITVSARISSMLDRMKASLPDKSVQEWIKIFLSLENLDRKWRDLLELLQSEYKNITFSDFDAHMASRESEYEQFAVYIIYRYFANSFDISEARVVALFTALCYRLIYTLGALIFSKTGKFDFEDQVELVRLFSSEIEYSTDNVEVLMDLL